MRSRLIYATLSEHRSKPFNKIEPALSWEEMDMLFTYTDKAMNDLPLAKSGSDFLTPAAFMLGPETGHAVPSENTKFEKLSAVLHSVRRHLSHFHSMLIASLAAGRRQPRRLPGQLHKEEVQTSSG